jgi:hypothetical protein
LATRLEPSKTLNAEPGQTSVVTVFCIATPIQWKRRLRIEHGPMVDGAAGAPRPSAGLAAGTYADHERNGAMVRNVTVAIVALSQPMIAITIHDHARRDV